MKIYGRNGIVEITLRPLGENPQDGAGFCDREMGIMMDVKFTAYDGRKRYVAMGWSDQNPDIEFLGKAFHFVLEPSDAQCVTKEEKCPPK